MEPNLEHQIKVKLVEALQLKIAPEKIDDGAPLFRDGLGLDSVDALEIVAMISESFNVEIMDSPKAREVLRSIHSIADYVRQHAGA